METKEAQFDLTTANKKWELWLNEFVKETGIGNVGLFAEADNEKQALKYLKNLIKIIKDNKIKIN